MEAMSLLVRIVETLSRVARQQPSTTLHLHVYVHDDDDAYDDVEDVTNDERGS